MYEHHHDGMECHDPRSMCGGRGHGHGGRDRRFEPHWGRHDMASEERMLYAFYADGGDDAMFDHRRGWHGGHGRDRQEFGFGRGPGRPERPLEQGDLRWLVLDLIAAQPRHGYEIIKAIEDMMNGHYTPSPGVIYPTLTFLEETGLIASEAQANKKLYCITEEGRAALEANAATIQAVRARIEGARMRFGGAPAPEMMRALDNLRVAIQVRLAKGELSPESLAAVTAALDRAAGEIERS